MTATDKNLFGIGRSNAVSNEEFVSYIKEYEAVLYRIAYQYVRNEHDACEMVSETVYKGYKNRKSLKQPEYFRAWITKILLRTCFNHLKRNKRNVPLNDEASKITDTDFCIDTFENGMLIDEALSRLKLEYKTVLLLRYYQDLSIKEVSKAMSIPENTVKTYTARALKQLRRLLKEDVFYE